MSSASVAPVAVLGVGAVGGLVAARAGAICVGTERSVAAIRAHGLTLTQGDTSAVTHPEAVERLEQPVALLVIAVKAYDLDAALGRIAPSALSGSLVLPLLNGLEHVDALRSRLRALPGESPRAPARVAAGSIGRLEVLSPEPGIVVQRTAGDALITVARPDGSDAALAHLRAPGIELVVRDDEGDVLWDKAARLAVLAAATVASGLAVGALRDDPAWRGRLEEALCEACAVAVAEGVELDPAGQWAIIDGMAPGLTTSAARDAAAGRPTELDAITGSVVRAARRLRLATPALDALLADAEAKVGAPA